MSGIATRHLKFKYPKMILLFVTFIVAYLIFLERRFVPVQGLGASGYVGTFILGALFSYGFTAAPAAALLIIISEGQNVFLAAFVAGLGALLSDLVLFRFVRHSLNEELESLSREDVVVWFRALIPSFAKKYILPVMAGVIIASPLPDELGVALLASIKTLPTRVFIMVSFVLNTAGILLILLANKGF
ncbi:MAG: hypothetical protein V1735_07165 [Nanoarchaeota archaeon]